MDKHKLLNLTYKLLYLANDLEALPIRGTDDPDLSNFINFGMDDIVNYIDDLSDLSPSQRRMIVEDCETYTGTLTEGLRIVRAIALSVVSSPEPLPTVVCEVLDSLDYEPWGMSLYRYTHMLSRIIDQYYANNQED